MAAALVSFAPAPGSVKMGDARLSSAQACAVSDVDIFVPTGTVLLGEDGPGAYGAPKEVKAFRIDSHEVTNRQFSTFVKATGYITQAEREGSSAIFVHPSSPYPLDAAEWWAFAKGADWRHPRGARMGEAKPHDPVVHVSYDDAMAYARWLGRTLPTSEQWERAARGNQAAGADPLSWAYDAKGRPRANTWQGTFPVSNSAEDGFDGIAPVGCFEPNRLGLYDMIGNVWEWTSDSGSSDGIRLLKGGSYLCARNYCANFRPAAWQAQEQDLGASHIGFRTAVSVSSDPDR